MKKAKQSTLFHSWARQSTHSNTRNDGSKNNLTDAVPTKNVLINSKPTGHVHADFSGYVAGTDLVENLDEFFIDDIANEVANNYSNDGELDIHTNNISKKLPAAKSLDSSLYEDIPGFDMESGKKYIYPTNYPIRDYQFNILKKCLFKNTLVSLPTGLGKTFIAAVLMYNYYRWYPNKKVVFLAPTKPLVAQQIEACFGIMGIPQSDTAEMTGNMAPKERCVQWQRKRVFFLTPQVMQNDLGRGSCPSDDICCVVFDEAHKALGNYAYCQVVKDLANAGGLFRVLALSATPGNDLKAVQQVITNLLISHIEIRSEESLDIQRYLHERKVEKLVVPLDGDVLDIKNIYRKILGIIVGRLVQKDVLYTNDIERLGKFQILQARDQFRKTSIPGPLSGAIEGDFALAISLYHAYELLLQHGLRSFYQFLKSSVMEGYHSKAKLELLSNKDFKYIMQRLSKCMGRDSLDMSHLNSSMYCPSINKDNDFFYSHPKLNHLENVVLKHFRSFQSDSDSGGQTRVMVFSQYRESVKEIADMLSRHAPLIRVMSFMGHGTTNRASKGQTQKEQLEVVSKFRDGDYNTLVSTCVGEEGLDIGEVDLIVCFDAHKSPVRLVQRMGRTGRKRSGRIVMIMAEGKEEQIYIKSQSIKNSIHKAIQKGSKSLQFYQFNHRMVPRHIHPEVEQVFITPGDYQHDREKKSTKKSTSSSKFSKQPFSFGPSTKNDPKGVYLTESELLYWNNNFTISEDRSRDIECAVDSCIRHKPLVCITTQNQTKPGNNTISLNRWIDWQTAPFPKWFVQDSSKSCILKSVLELTDQLQVTPDLTNAYDCEMMTFLDRNDVIRNDDVISIQEQECGNDETNKEGMRRKSRKNKSVRQIFNDSSDEDEDFQTPQKKRNRANDCVECDLKQMDTETNSCVPHTCTDDDLSSSVDNDPTPPLSQTIVPRAPSLSAIAWLDDITSMSSQFSLTQTPCLPVEKKSPHLSNSLLVCGSSQRKSNEFVKPKEPPSSIKKKTVPTTKERHLCSLDQIPITPFPVSKLDQDVLRSPTLTSSTPVRGVVAASTDEDYGVSLLNELPSEVLFGDDNVSESLSILEPSVIPESPPVRQRLPLKDREQQSTQVDNCSESVKRSPSSSPDMPCLKDRVTVNVASTTYMKKSPTCTFKSEKVIATKSSPIGNLTHSTPLSSCKFPTPDSEEKFLKNVRTLKRIRQPFQQPDFLCSQVTAPLCNDTTKTRQRVMRTNYANTDDDDDFVIQPLKKRVLFSPSSELSPDHESNDSIVEDNDLIDEEAILSGNSRSADEQEEMAGYEYDYDDSFINDNSVLTQHVTAIQHKHDNTESTNSGNVSNDKMGMYLKSLRSPDNLFSRKRTGNNSKYRLVLSQRYELLNKYVKKAGLHVSPSARRRKRRKRRNVTVESQESEESEAEEVMKVTDDPELTDDSQELLDSCVMSNTFDNHSEQLDKNSKRRARVHFLSESDSDEEDTRLFEEQQQTYSSHHHLTNIQRHCQTKWRSNDSNNNAEPIVLLSSSDEEDNSSQSKAKMDVTGEDIIDDKEMVTTIADLVSQGVIVSPSLVMHPSDHDPHVFLEFSFDAPFRFEKVSQPINNGNHSNAKLDINITGEDNVDILLDNELPLMDEEFEQFMEVCSDKDLFNYDESDDSNQTSSTRTVHHNDILQEYSDQTEAQPPSIPSPVHVPIAPVVKCVSSGTSSTSSDSVARGDCVPTNTDTITVKDRMIILMDSKELVCSQVVSYLRHKETITVEVCSMGQGGGYTISNRAVLERKTQSDISAASSSKKLITRIRYLEELYDKVYLVFERDSTEKLKIGGTKKSTKGQYESTLAKLTSMANVYILYSHSQESTAAVIAELVKSEYHRGYGITIPLTLINTSSNILKVLMKTPGMTFVTALNLIASFRNISDIVSCLSPNDMKKHLKYLSRKKAKSFIDFFHKQFNHHLTC